MKQLYPHKCYETYFNELTGVLQSGVIYFNSRVVESCLHCFIRNNAKPKPHWTLVAKKSPKIFTKQSRRIANSVLPKQIEKTVKRNPIGALIGLVHSVTMIKIVRASDWDQDAVKDAASKRFAKKQLKTFQSSSGASL